MWTIYLKVSRTLSVLEVCVCETDCDNCFVVEMVFSPLGPIVSVMDMVATVGAQLTPQNMRLLKIAKIASVFILPSFFSAYQLMEHHHRIELDRIPMAVGLATANHLLSAGSKAISPNIRL
jgi:hypothetical protein